MLASSSENHGAVHGSLFYCAPPYILTMGAPLLNMCKWSDLFIIKQ